MLDFRQWWQGLQRRLQRRWQEYKAPGNFLCDTCRYDYGQACRRQERPNATRCPDYRPR